MDIDNINTSEAMQFPAGSPNHEFRSHSLFTEEELDRWAQTVALRIPTAPEPDPHLVLSVMASVIRADKPQVLGLAKFHRKAVYTRVTPGTLNPQARANPA